MRLDQSLRERQAEAGAFVSAVEVTIDLAETRHRLGHVFGRDADAGIDDLEHVTAVGPAPGPDRNLASGLGELDRVGQEVDEDLLELTFVGPQRRQLVRDLERELQLLFAGALSNQRQRGTNEAGNVDVLFAEVVRPELDLGEIQSILERSSMSLMTASRC